VVTEESLENWFLQSATYSNDRLAKIRKRELMKKAGLSQEKPKKKKEVAPMTQDQAILSIIKQKPAKAATINRLAGLKKNAP